MQFSLCCQFSKLRSILRIIKCTACHLKCALKFSFENTWIFVYEHFIKFHFRFCLFCSRLQKYMNFNKKTFIWKIWTFFYNFFLLKSLNRKMIKHKRNLMNFSFIKVTDIKRISMRKISEVKTFLRSTLNDKCLFFCKSW